MNMISLMRERVSRCGMVSLNVDDFNQLQAEWITRTRDPAPTNNGIEELDSICQKYNDGKIDVGQLVCTVWNTALAVRPNSK